MSNEWFCWKNDFLQWVSREFYNKKTEIFWNEQFLQQLTSKFCNEQRVILQRVTSNEWKGKTMAENLNGPAEEIDQLWL